MKNLILTAIIAISLLTSCGHSTPDNSDAKEAARAAIIHSLKDPMSVQFHHNEIIKDLGNNLFEYTETVNAKNSFGGSIAQNITVKVQWISGDPSEVENWKFSDLQFNER